MSSQGSSGALLVIEAEGVRNLSGMTLDQAAATPGESVDSSTALVAGSTYLVRSRHGLAVMHVVQIRGIESLRNAPPAALRGPHMGGSEVAPRGGTEPDLTLVLEWKLLQP